MRPLRIAILHGDRQGSFFARCHTPLTWLLRQGAIEVLPPLKAWEADVVVLHHQWQPSSLSVVHSLRRHGIRVVLDVDEDIFAEALDPASPKIYRHPAVQGFFRQLIQAVDAVLVPTEYLAAKLARAGSKVLLNPNGIDLGLWREAPRSKLRDGQRVVGFAGSASHGANLEILRPALAKLSKKFKDEGILFTCLGFRPAWLSGVLAGAEVGAACDARQYVTRLSLMGVDVALAPLSNAEFNKSRSPLKIWEYTAAGAVTIASNREPYASAIQSGSTGLLVENQPEAWSQAIWKLIRNDDLRRQMLESARQSVEAHDVSRTAPRMLEALEATAPNRHRTFFASARTQQKPHPNVDVVIPIYNAPALARQAIEAVLAELDEAHRLVLIDDASSDPAVGSMLDQYEGRAWVTIHRSSENRGFVGTCNFAAMDLARQDADLIFMNSDTRPMRGFVRRLAETAGSNPSIGTVTAVTNQGSIATVPSVSDSAQLANELEHPVVMAPTAVGHLMYIKREAVTKYGLFDMAFSPGYGEEVDFSLRIAHEYAHVIDPGCWTWHQGSASFEATMSELRKQHDALIDQRYPQFQLEVAAFHASNPLRDHRLRILSTSRDPRRRILHAAHSYLNAGGTEKHIRDLERALSGQFLSCAAAPEPDLRLFCGENTIAAWPYTPAGSPMTVAELPSNDPAWEAILRAFKPDLIHFHHLLHHPLNLLMKLAGTGIPVVVSIHDYFFLCPDYTLQFCPGLHSCDTCFPERFKGPADYQRLRRQVFNYSLRKAAAIVAPSRAAADLMREVYPDLNIRVIPHGINPMPRVERQPAPKIRFGMIGNVTLVKGIEIILKAWPLVRNAAGAELHIFGAASNQGYIERCAQLGIHYHGAYREADLPGILASIDVGVLPSQQPETFCYALSEFFAGGVPVIGSHYGALAERIVSGVNGLKVPRDDVQAWANAIDLVIQDGALRRQITEGVRPSDSIEVMAGQYATLYTEILEKTHATSHFSAPELVGVSA